MKPRFHISRNHLPSLIAVSILLASTCAIRAASVTKADTGSNLNDTASWVGAATPTATDTATWGATSLVSGLTLSPGASWLGIGITAALADITISGAGALTLGTGGIYAAGSLSLGNPVVLAADQTWTSITGFQLNATGPISGGGQLTVTGAGTVNLSGSNGFSGGTIRQGIGPLGLASANALGSGGLLLQSTRTSADDTLILSTGITVPNVITANLNSGREGILSSSGDNTLSGAFNIIGSAGNHIYFENVAGVGTTFSISGAITAPNMTEGISFRGDVGNLGLVSGAVNLNGFFEINGGATWTVTSSSNSWTQTRIQGVDNGGFTLGADNALATAARLWFGNNTSGTLDLAGFDQTIGGIDCPATAKNPKVGNSSTTEDSLLNLNSGGYTFAGSLVDILGSGTRKLSVNLLSGSQTLSGINTYTGSTTITSGSLTVNGSLAAGSSVVVQAGGTLTGTGTVNGPVTVSGVLTGTGTMAGAVSLESGGVRTGSNTINGAVTVKSGGKLMGSGTLSGPVTIQNGGNITPGDGISAATATLSSLSLGATGTDFQTINIAQGLSNVAVTGGITRNGTTTINIGTTSTYTAGITPLITYTGPTITNGFALGGTPPRVVASLVFDPGSINLNVTDPGDTAKWTGAASGVWNTIAGNWKLAIADTSTTYINGAPGDPVIFQDLLTGNPAVTLATTVSPASVTFDNTATAYSLSGTAGIAGTTGLTKTGTGTLTLGTSNTFSGAVTVSAGTVKITHPNALGSTAAGTTVAASSGLHFESGVAVSGEALTVQGVGTDGTGALRNLSGNNSWTGDIAFSNSTIITSDDGTLTLGSIAESNRHLIMNGSGNVTINEVISGSGSASGSIFASGNNSGKLTLKGADTYTGAISITNGTLSLEGSRTVDSGAIYVASITGQTGKLDFSNGNFTAALLYVGDAATSAGIVNQTSGTLGSTGNLLVGSGTGATGTYNLSGGTLIAKANTSNGNSLILGTNPGASGIFNLSDTGTLVIGGSNAILQISRCNSTTSSSSGTFNQTGGSATLSRLAIGGGSANNDFSIGVLNLTGGVFTVVNGFSFLSRGDDSSSKINIGGNADVTLPAFPVTRGTNSTATITLNGGTLRPTAASTAYMGSLNNAFLTANGANFNVPTGNDITISQVFENAPSQTGILTKAGSGKLTLTGLNIYSGSTIVNAGILAVNGTAIPGKLVINGGKVEPTGTEVVTTLFFGATQQAAGTWGATGSGATNINNTYFSGTGIVSVTSGSAGYSSWAAAYAPGQTADQDHDKDGVKNGLEYFMGTTGSSFTANPAPVNRKVTWPKDPTFSGSYFIEISNTMAAGSWTNVPVNGTNPKDNGTSVEYTLPSGQGEIFTRLQVEPN